MGFPCAAFEPDPVARTRLEALGAVLLSDSLAVAPSSGTGTAVARELAELRGQNYDLRLTAFDSREIEELLRAKGKRGSFSGGERIGRGHQQPGRRGETVYSRKRNRV